MPINYEAIKFQSALKLAALIGTSQSTLESSYTGSWATVLDSAEIPISAFKDQILMIEKAFAEAIGDNLAHPARTFLYAASAPLATGASIPSTDANGAEWVGVFDSVIDGSDSIPLTAQPVQTIQDLNNSFFSDTDLYNSALFGNNIYHTRTTAIIQGCSWNYATQSAAYDADGDSPLPQYLANGWVAGVVGSSPQVGWADPSGAFQVQMQIYQEALASIAAPSTALPLSAAANQVSG